MPARRQERSRSLDMTNQGLLAGARRKLLAKLTSYSMSNASVASIAASSDSDLSTFNAEHSTPPTTPTLYTIGKSKLCWFVSK